MSIHAIIKRHHGSQSRLIFSPISTEVRRLHRVDGQRPGKANAQEWRKLQQSDARPIQQPATVALSGRKWRSLLQVASWASRKRLKHTKNS